MDRNALTTSEILRTLEQHGPTIRGYGVRALGLFGSRARGTAGVEILWDVIQNKLDPLERAGTNLLRAA